MSFEERNGLPHSFGNDFLLPNEDDFSQSDQGESIFPSSDSRETGHHASPPPPPLVTLPTSNSRVERYKTTQALLACKHQDGNSVCAHVLKMKSYIDKLDRMGVAFPREQTIDLVLLSLPKSYDQFIENFLMMDSDVTLIDLS